MRKSVSKNEDLNFVKDAALGFVAGAAGVWAMDKVSWLMYNHESQEALRKEQEARKGDNLDTSHTAVAKVAEHLDMGIEPKQPNAIGIGLHYLLGMMPGAIYSILWHRSNAVGASRGVLYGAGLSLTQDEGMAPLLGLAASPTKYPWQAHVRGVVSHVVLGVVTDLVIRGFSNSVRKI